MITISNFYLYTTKKNEFRLEVCFKADSDSELNSFENFFKTEIDKYPGKKWIEYDAIDTRAVFITFHLPNEINDFIRQVNYIKGIPDSFDRTTTKKYHIEKVEEIFGIKMEEENLII